MFLNYLQLRQLHPDPDKTALPPSLDDIEQDDIKNPPADPIAPKDPPAPPEGETDEEKEAREVKEAKEKQDKLDAEEEAKRLAEEAKKPKVKPEDDAPKDPAAEEVDEGLAFWEDVDKLRGEALEVDFGDVDPMTPEGALIRERAVADDAVAKFESHLETTYPEGYAFLEHLAAGGKVEDFMQRTAELVSLPTESELENNENFQEQIVTMNLKNKGNTDKTIERIIKGMKEDDELEENAKIALKEEQKREQDTIKAVRDESQRVEKEKATAIGEMKTYIDELVNTGEIDGIVIPDKDKPLFADFIRKSVRYADGKFIMTTQLTQENIQEVFKKEYFGFKKGNLKELVAKQARTENTNRLRRTITDRPAAKGAPVNGETIVTLGEID